MAFYIIFFLYCPIFGTLGTNGLVQRPVLKAVTLTIRGFGRVGSNRPIITSKIQNNQEFVNEYHLIQYIYRKFYFLSLAVASLSS